MEAALTVEGAWFGNTFQKKKVPGEVVKKK